MLGLTKGAIFAIGATAAAAVVGAVAYRVWQTAEPGPMATTAPAPAVPSVAAPSVAARNDVPPPPVSGSNAGQPAAVAGASPQGSRPALPGFDIVRVEPTGDAVVAGRATPNAQVTLLDRGTVIAQMKADSNGQFVLVPPPLPAGNHLLALGEKSGSGQVISNQTVAVAVPKKKNSEGVVVALSEPDRPTRVLSDAAQPAPTAVEPQKSAAAPAVAIRTVETEDHGGFFATGSGAPGAEVKLYLNGSAVADVHAGQDGHWSLQIAKGMQPGSYAVRADEIDAASGKVIARAEVPFDYKAVVAESGSNQTVAKTGVATQDDAAPNGSAAPAAGNGTNANLAATDNSPNDAVLAAISTVTVVRGDSLWRISRKVLGRGIRYTQIYAANVSQIRDPALIYPGQVLVKPQTSVN